MAAWHVRPPEAVTKADAKRIAGIRFGLVLKDSKMSPFCIFDISSGTFIIFTRPLTLPGHAQVPISSFMFSVFSFSNCIFDKMSWTEGGTGTVTAYLRSAATSGGVSAASWVEYTNGELDHTERYRYYQVKIEFIEGSDGSPEVSNLVVRHKALIPRSDYNSLGPVNCGVDIDFSSFSAGNVSITLDNKSSHYDKYQAASYIYGINFYHFKLAKDEANGDKKKSQEG